MIDRGKIFEVVISTYEEKEQFKVLLRYLLQSQDCCIPHQRISFYLNEVNVGVGYIYYLNDFSNNNGIEHNCFGTEKRYDCSLNIINDYEEILHRCRDYNPLTEQLLIIKKEIYG